MTDAEIEVIKEWLARKRVVCWHSDNVFHTVRGLNQKYVPPEAPDDEPEPVAVLTSGKVVALYNSNLSDFCYVNFC